MRAGHSVTILAVLVAVIVSAAGAAIPTPAQEGHACAVTFDALRLQQCVLGGGTASQPPSVPDWVVRASRGTW